MLVVFLLPTRFSPPIRWGLLDLMSALSSSSFSSSSFAYSSLSSCCPAPTAMSSVPCRTCTAKTATVWAQCSLPDLNCDLLCPVFPARPQPRPSALSVPCRTSTATCCAQCSLPDLCAQCSLPDLNRETECQKECQIQYVICQKECQKECQREFQKICQKDC